MTAHLKLPCCLVAAAAIAGYSLLHLIAKLPLLDVSLLICPDNPFDAVPPSETPQPECAAVEKTEACRLKRAREPHSRRVFHVLPPAVRAR